MKSLLDYENIFIFLTRGVILFSAFAVFTTFFYEQGWKLSHQADSFLMHNVAAISQSSAIQNILFNSIDQNQIPDKLPNPPEIEAMAATSVKIKNGNTYVLLNQNSQKKLPIASLTKLMTALVVFEKYDLNQIITIDESVMTQEGVQGVLKVGDRLSVKDLLYVSLIESSNRAAFALAKIIGPENFVLQMNQTAKRLNLTNTYFSDSTGLGENSYSSAEDLVKLTRYLFEHYPLFSEITSQKKYTLYSPDGTIHHVLENTNKLLEEFTNLLGGKTGYTNLAKGCVMIIEKNNTNQDYFIHIVLGADNRFLEMKKIITWVNES